ncbi:hypothetical protein PIB30_061267, partial [Stylosanthes scabra]|nr:hypothetical protein [Stylosanthes scabra]
MGLGIENGSHVWALELGPNVTLSAERGELGNLWAILEGHVFAPPKTWIKLGSL